MRVSKTLRRLLLGMFGFAVFAGFGTVNASEPDPAIMTFKLPDKIVWNKNQAILYGDPQAPGGFYQVLTKWPPHTMSRPHFHQNDRYIYVLSGTWWVGWGPKYDPGSTYPMPAGSYVQHYAKKIHYDGSKDGEVLLLISGIGPEKSTPAEEK
jgi:quercetin dioxygenase-like cupin family protein